MKIKYPRAILSFMVVLLVFLMIGDYIVVWYQTNLMMGEAQEHARHEIELMGLAAKEALLKKDYATVELLVKRWGSEREAISEIMAIAPNGFLLAEYKEAEPPEYPFSLRYDVRHDEKKLITLVMVEDFTPIHRSMKVLNARLIAGSVILTAIMGFVLWFSQKRMALQPLEREIEKRKVAEKSFVRVLEDMELMVDERTTELRSERDRAQRYLDIAGVIFLFLDRDCKVGLINKKGCEILGYDENDIAGKDWVDNFIPERLRHQVRGVFTKLMAGEVKLMEYYENPVLTKDGEERLIAWHNSIVKDEFGKVLGTLSSGEDSTERKRVENERKKIISTLNTVLEHVPEGVVLLDERQRIVFVNPIGVEYLRILTGAGTGAVLTDISGRLLKDFMVSPSQMMWHEVEVDGASMTVFEVAGREIVQDGNVTGMVLALKDITDAKQIEDRIASQERLAAVGQLAAGIAHDFNNVLTGVIGYAEILHNNIELPVQARQQAQAILHSGQRAADLIGQILDFSRKSAGEFTKLELMSFMKEFMKFIERLIPEAIHITFDAELGSYWVNANVTKMQQVLTNLAVNARDAMPTGGRLRFGLSHYTLKEGDPPLYPGMSVGKWIVITVGDTGGGIMPEDLPHIFEPFYTTKEKGTGTGLGLAQVYGIVKLHGGYIDVKTVYGEKRGNSGSTFIISLPESKEGEVVLDSTVEREMQYGRGETVLVVEDDHVVLDLIEKMVSSAGYKVITATDGREALKALDEYGDSIKLCITDVVMPGLDGIELGRRMKSINPSIKIIAVSGYALGVDKEELEEAGIVEWVQKPFQARSLMEAVRSVFKK